MTTVLNNHSDDKQQEKLEKCKKLLSLRSAPLASFEDLPTDEQNSSTSHSSDDDNEEKQQQQQRPESSSSGQQTLQSSSQITVLITDHDDDGSGGDRIHSAAASIINDDGASSLSPKLPKANQRKGSWTDIFFGRKSPTIIPTKERKFSLLSFKFSFKDDNKQQQQQQCELTPMTVIDSRRKTPSPPVIIDCGIQLTPTNHSNIDDLFSITTTTSNNTIVFIHENPEGSSSIIESKTELPITKQQPSQESDCDSLCSLCQHNDDKLPPFCHETNTTDDQTECSECEICCENNHVANNNESTDMDMIADYEDNNDDDDDKQINNNNNHLKLDSSYDSYELEMLVKNDELDLNRKFHHHSNDDYKIEGFNDTGHYNNNNNNRRPSFGKNLDENFQSKNLPKLSIERPHSIVPVTNIEKFEAYLDKFAIKNNNDDDEMKADNSSKLKIILPVDITKSSRYSRKSNPFIWLQFCEQGLKSPKILRKRAKSCFPSLTPQFFFNSFTDLNNDDLKASSPGNLTPITPLKNLDMVDGDVDIFRNDHFEPKINFKKSKMKNQSMNSECTCSCATTTTTTTPLTSPTITMTTNNTTNNLVSLTTATTIDSETNICFEITSEDESMIEQSERSKKNNPKDSTTMVELIGEDQPLLVSPCDCICHHHQIISSTKKEFATKIQDKKKNVEQQMTSDEITSSDLCLISSSSSSTTLSSSTTSSSSSSSTSSSVSSPSSSISPSSTTS